MTICYRLIGLGLMVWLNLGNAAQLEIFRCPQEDGTVAFQQTPCRAPTATDSGEAEETGAESEERDRAESSAENGTDSGNSDDRTTSSPVPEAAPALTTGNGENRAECEKKTRDAIDAIDAELQNSSSTEDDRAHLSELLELTRRLRQCKQL